MSPRHSPCRRKSIRPADPHLSRGRCWQRMPLCGYRRKPRVMGPPLSIDRMAPLPPLPAETAPNAQRPQAVWPMPCPSADNVMGPPPWALSYTPATTLLPGQPGFAVNVRSMSNKQRQPLLSAADILAPEDDPVLTVIFRCECKYSVVPPAAFGAFNPEAIGPSGTSTLCVDGDGIS
mmetsp:Transcript_37759/g.121446  ORF Transcript_37759/g.121446 Transcript_37759/m.121446 type:complete len:177 (-) Transcript_37759:175-705(-)